MEREKGYIGCPTSYRTRHFFNNFTVSQQLDALQARFFSFLTQRNVPLFKFRCNILIGVIIIKEISGTVASGTPYIRSENTGR
jgi:hypothetical protein